MTRKLALLFICSVFLLSSCGGDDSPATEVPLATATIAIPTATPVPVKPTESAKQAAPTPTNISAAESPLAAASAFDSPLAQQAISPLAAPLNSSDPLDYQPLTVPAPTAGKATLTGRLVAKYGTNPNYEPVVLAGVYLARIIRDEKGDPVVASLDNQNDPNSSTDPNGYFQFQDVPPGQYAFMVFSGYSYYLIRDTDEKQLLVTLEKDEAKDMGLVQTSLPPE